MHPFENQLRGGGGKCREDAARVEPADAGCKDRVPVEIAGLEHGAGFVGPVVKHEGGPDALAAVAVNCGQVRPPDAVVVEPLVERCYTGLAHPRLHELADAVADHGGRDARAQAKAIRQPRGHVVFAARDVNLERACLAEGNDARVEAVDQGAEGQKIQRALGSCRKGRSLMKFTQVRMVRSMLGGPAGRPNSRGKKALVAQSPIDRLPARTRLAIGWRSEKCAALRRAQEPVQRLRSRRRREAHLGGLAMSGSRRDLPRVGSLCLAGLVASAALAGADFPSVSQLPAQPELPDPLVLLNGERVVNKEQWVQKRRPELKALFEHYMYGSSPPAPAKIEAMLEREDRQALGGRATLKELTIGFGPPDMPKIHLLLVVPHERKKPAPVFVGMNFAGNHTVLKDQAIRLPTAWMPGGYPGVKNNRATDAGRGAQEEVWALDQSIQRGYAVATFYCGDVDPDRSDLREGIQPHFNQPGRGAAGAVRLGNDCRLGLGPTACRRLSLHRPGCRSAQDRGRGSFTTGQGCHARWRVR